ncbi:MAG TPA: hypothetical protein VNL71_00410 [Chloroflexota bacterium]|nr:hypothetical protein [Chloroflexota bacterium]
MMTYRAVQSWRATDQTWVVEGTEPGREVPISWGSYQTQEEAQAEADRLNAIEIERSA